MSDEYDYEVISDPDPSAAQPHEAPPSNVRHALLLSMPEDLKARLRADRRAAGREDQGGGPAGIAARARALEAFLRDSGQFSYTLADGSRWTRKLDPVEDFLVNRKEGHCEYFASALALCCAPIDIPARMVNGFKGGDWNELTADPERPPETRP